MFVASQRHGVAVLIAMLVVSLAPAPAAANMAPDPPVIVSPAPTDVGPEDVHMELLDAFHDPDGDDHAATDWEIRTDDGAAVVWAGYASPVLIHAHFSDGVFQGPLAGRRQLDPRAIYRFRVRFQDSRGAWSDWAERQFATSRADRMPPQRVRGLLSRPAPSWRSDGGTPVMLPDGARLVLETADGTALLTFAGAEGGMQVRPGALVPEPALLRLRVRAPAEAGLQLPDSRLAVITEHPERLLIYLPALRLAAAQEQLFWVSVTGATFYPDPSQPTAFDRDRLARDAPLPWQLQPGFRIEAVTATFELPTSLAFVADPGTDPAAPRFYVTELHGRIKVVTNDGRALIFADNLLNFSPSKDLPGDGEQGVIGVCLPPEGHDVYATMVRTDERGLFRIKVVRLRSPDGLTVTGVEDVLAAGSEDGRVRPSHQIQQCSFGPDGKLYTFVADGTGPKQGANDATFNGKVLRMNPDGSAPSDNPRYDPAQPNAPISYQYTKGHRNAFGQAWRPSTGQLYLTENGPNVDRIVRVVPGQNYGWNGTDDSMRTNALYVWPEPHWAPVGLAFAEGAAARALPAAKQGHLLVATSGLSYGVGPQRAGKAIQEFVLNEDGSITAPPTIFARYIGEGRGTFIDLKIQPDGVYVTDIYQHDDTHGPTAPGGRVWRISNVGEASFTASSTSGTAPLTVDFADTSTVSDAQQWSWDFGDGTTSDERSPTHTFAQPGRYVVQLSVTSEHGQSSEHLEVVTVAGDAASPDALPEPLALPASPEAIYFPETGRLLGGGFKIYWEQHGGLSRFGYPLTGEFQEVNPADGQTYTVQYFERARFEYHPEHKGTPFETQLGLLGRQAAAGRADEAPFRSVGQREADALYIEATSHTLAGVFREYWEATGGAESYGYPISEPFEEHVLGGPRYLVQYFERTRLEYYPDFAGTGGQVRPARLGTFLMTYHPAPRRSGE